MKKTLSFICAIIMLCSVVVPCFASGVDFYAKPDDQLLLQAMEKEETDIRSRLSVGHKYNISPPQDDNLEEEKFEFDLEHVFKYKPMSTTQIIELLKTEDVSSFDAKLTTRFYYVPFYYKREQNPEPSGFIRLQNKDGQIVYNSIDPWSTNDALTYMQNEELTLQKIKEIGGEGYTWIYNFCLIYGAWFSLVEKNGERYVLYTSGNSMVTDRYWEAMPQEYKDMLNTPVWTIDQADDFFAEYQHIEETLKLPVTDEVLYTGVGSVEENQHQYQWLYWIIGGAVVVIGGLVTVILVKKKKA